MDREFYGDLVYKTLERPRTLGLCPEEEGQQLRTEDLLAYLRTTIGRMYLNEEVEGIQRLRDGRHEVTFRSEDKKTDFITKHTPIVIGDLRITVERPRLAELRSYDEFRKVFIYDYPVEEGNQHLITKFQTFGNIVNVEDLTYRGTTIRNGTRIIRYRTIERPIPTSLSCRSMRIRTKHDGQDRAPVCSRCRTKGHYWKECPELLAQGDWKATEEEKQKADEARKKRLAAEKEESEVEEEKRRAEVVVTVAEEDGAEMMDSWTEIKRKKRKSDEVQQKEVRVAKVNRYETLRVEEDKEDEEVDKLLKYVKANEEKNTNYVKANEEKKMDGKKTDVERKRLVPVKKSWAKVVEGDEEEEDMIDGSQLLFDDLELSDKESTIKGSDSESGEEEDTEFETSEASSGSEFVPEEVEAVGESQWTNSMKVEEEARERRMETYMEQEGLTVKQDQDEFECSPLVITMTQMDREVQMASPLGMSTSQLDRAEMPNPETYVIDGKTMGVKCPQ